MKKYIFIAILLICSTVHAEDYVCYETAFGVTNLVTEIRRSVDPTEVNCANSLQVTRTELETVISDPYYKIESNTLARLSAQEESDLDTARASAYLTQERNFYKNEYDTNKALIAFAKIVMDEINILRGQHGLQDRTLQQLKTAIKNEIDNQ